jgi:hypothetical protein
MTPERSVGEEKKAEKNKSGRKKKTFDGDGINGRTFVKSSF